MAGEKAAQAQKESAQAEARQYPIHLGPLGLKMSADMRASYTDNVFYTQTNRAEDYLLNPNLDLGASLQVSELNTLVLSLGVGYEYYLNHKSLNGDAPLVHPGSELAFNVFVGDVHLRFHDRFSYEESLFFNTYTGERESFFNFNNVGVFKRLDNRTGLDVYWSPRHFLLSAGYEHEYFDSSTSEFEYLNRSSEWFTASAGYFPGDHVQVGLEGRYSLHDYKEETVLNDNWRARGGPFVELTLPQNLSLRGGGGFETARYDEEARGSDLNTYYLYGQIRQRTRFFTHTLEGGRELELGENANNMRSIYARYSIASPIIAHVRLTGHAAVNVAEESGGPSGFDEKFTYYTAGAKATWFFSKHWHAEAGYEFKLKESDLSLRDFTRNQVTIGAGWNF
jgi:hypothetical protein